MLKKLRRKFVLLNMAMVSVVVVALLCVIGVFSWQQNMSSLNTALDMSLNQAAKNRTDAGQMLTDSLFGSFGFSNGDNTMFNNGQPSFPLGGDQQQGQDGSAGNAGDGSGSSDGSDGDAPAVPQLGGTAPSTIPVAVYRVVEGSSVSLVSRVTTASLDDATLEQAINQVLSEGAGEGFLQQQQLYYKTHETAYVTFVAFADEASASSWRGLVLVLVGIGVLTLLVFFVISLFFSRWALRPVEEAWDQQKRFVADASHELKTPITVVLANTSIMLKHPEQTVSSQAQWLESTQHEAEGMQELVNDLLDLARLESSEQVAFDSVVDMSDLVEGRVLLFESVAFEREVFIEDNVAANVQVKGSQTHLERLCTILLDNACKYANPQSTIHVSLERGPAAFMGSLPHATVQGTAPKGPCALLKVSNTGASVGEEDLPHLFDRFYRSDKARTRTEGSYGLGLAIAAQTVESHGGAIAAQSLPESETTFFVALPVA
ncbi:MAG: HAMP domain-containing sensor histidine kinase [Coriobacteriia bacterium]|nr:HAMP domain-containing sensor histidine kinase [Coriobacteriia bacterium]